MADRSQTQRDAFFTRVVREHAQFLLRVAASVLRHPQDAEDAVQDALLKLYRGESWRGMTDERAFLARVVWRVSLDRKAARPVLAADDAEYGLRDARDTPEAVAASGDERALLQSWIEELAAELREPLLLSAMDGMNSREIGVVMGIPEGTVRTRLMRARAELRAKWERQQEQQRQAAQRDRAGRDTTIAQGAAVS